VDVKEFGAECTGSLSNAATDTPAIQNALAYALSIEPAVVRLPGNGLCAINATLTVGNGVSIKELGAYNFSGFAAASASLNPMISLSGFNAGLSDLYMDGAASGSPPTGTLVYFAPAIGKTFAKNLYIYRSCTALDVNGYLQDIRDVYIANPNGAACDVITVGRSTTGASTTNTLFDHVSVYDLSPAVAAANSCFRIYDAGGIFITHSDAVKCATGTIIKPGTNQIVILADPR